MNESFMKSETITLSERPGKVPALRFWTSMVLGLVVVLTSATYLPGQETPSPEPAQPAEQPAKPLSPEEQKALVDDTNKTAVAANEEADRGWRNHQTWRPPIVVIGHNVEVKAGESVEAVVVIGGSAKIHGRVHEAVVVVGGDLDVWGSIG